MINKIIWGSVMILIPITIAVGVVVMNSTNEEKENRVLDDAYSLSEAIVGLQSGVTSAEDINSLPVNNDVKNKVLDRLNSLERLNSATYNITSLYDQNYSVRDEWSSEITSSYGAEDGYSEENITEEWEESYQQEYFNEDFELEEDPRLVVDDQGNTVIPVTELDFSITDYDLVNYQNTTITVDKSDVPLTYDQMKRDPNNTYIYQTHKVEKGKKETTISILFESLLTQSGIIVKVKLDEHHTIVDFEVR